MHGPINIRNLRMCLRVLITVSDVQRAVRLLATVGKVPAGSTNFLDRRAGHGRCGLIYLIKIFTGNTRETNR